MTATTLTAWNPPNADWVCFEDTTTDGDAYVLIDKASLVEALP